MLVQRYSFSFKKSITVPKTYKKSEKLRSNFVRLQKARNKFGISLDLHYL